MSQFESANIYKRSMGRTKNHEVRAQFSDPYSDPDKVTERCHCKHCNEEVTAQINRMKSHLHGCNVYHSNVLSDEAEPKKRKLPSGPLSSFVDRMSVEQQEHADYLLARAIHRSARPFSLFDDELWEDFFKDLRPSFKIPSVERISSELLTNQYLEVKSDVNSVLLENSMTGVQFSTDGLTDIKKRSIFNLMVNTPIPFFLKSFRLLGKEESAINLLGEIVPEVLNLHDRFIASDEEKDILVAPPENHISNWKSIMSLICDNPNVMRKLRRDITESFNVDVIRTILFFGVGCASHSLNSLVHDLLLVEPFKTTKSRSTVLISYFNQTHRALVFLHRAMTEKYGKVFALFLFTRTRWNSIIMMWYSLHRARASVRSLVIIEVKPGEDPFEVPAKQMAVLTSGSFGNQLDISINFTKPIGFATSYLEGDLVPFGSAYGAFLYLKHLFLNWDQDLYDKYPELKEYTQTKIALRWKKISHPFQAVAFLFDPFWASMIGSIGIQNISLNGKTLMTEVREGLKLAAPNSVILRELYCEMELYVSRRGEFGDTEFVDHGKVIHPKVWWALISETPHLKALLTRLYSHQNTSASGERHFKVHNMVHSKSRNALKDVRVEKQSFVAYNHQKTKRDINSFRREGSFEKVLSGFDLGDLETDFITFYSELESDSDVENNELESDLDEDDVGSHEEAAVEARWCICRSLVENNTIQCDNHDNCAGFEWYHFECIGLDPDNLPDQYLCDMCVE